MNRKTRLELAGLGEAPTKGGIQPEGQRLGRWIVFVQLPGWLPSGAGVVRGQCAGSGRERGGGAATNSSV